MSAMRQALGLLAVIVIGCGPKQRAGSPAHADDPPVRAVAVPMPAPEEDAGGTVGESAPDTGAEDAGDAGQLGPGVAPEPKLSPRLPVKFGAVFRNPANPVFGAEIVLFRRRVSCADAARADHPERVFTLTADWAVPFSGVSTVVSLKNGQMTSYRAKVEVLSAPPRVGALGKIELEQGEDYNVGGGVVEVLVCT